MIPLMQKMKSVNLGKMIFACRQYNHLRKMVIWILYRHTFTEKITYILFSIDKS